MDYSVQGVVTSGKLIAATDIISVRWLQCRLRQKHGDTPRKLVQAKRILVHFVIVVQDRVTEKILCKRFVYLPMQYLPS